MSNLYSLRAYRCLLWLGLLIGACSGAWAQTSPPDTTRLSYGEEVTPAPAIDAPLRVQAEDRHLWKVGLNNFIQSDREDGSRYQRLGGHLIYERRLDSPAWTVLAEVSPAFTRYRAEPGAASRRGLGVRTQVAGRYYYNLERRLRLGKNTSNFSANYVSVALSTGLGRQARETSFYFVSPDGCWLRADAAVLYGLQRRLGRYGFIDANVGVVSLLSLRNPQSAISGSLRMGLALGSWPAPPYARPGIPVDKDETLMPKAYVGVQLGSYIYRVRYSEVNPYPGLFLSYGEGHGVYDREVKVPYLYAGYYLRPRLAVQLGMQRQAGGYRGGGSKTDERDLALPVLLRYSLTRSFLRRVQFDAVGGLVPVWSSVHYEEQQFAYSFKRSTFGMHASLGLNVGYGFGRRRRVQITAEQVVTKDLRDDLQDFNSLQGGISLGLRYRFIYR